MARIETIGSVGGRAPQNFEMTRDAFPADIER